MVKTSTMVGPVYPFLNTLKVHTKEEEVHIKVEILIPVQVHNPIVMVQEEIVMVNQVKVTILMDKKLLLPLPTLQVESHKDLGQLLLKLVRLFLQEYLIWDILGLNSLLRGIQSNIHHTKVGVDITTLQVLV